MGNKISPDDTTPLPKTFLLKCALVGVPFFIIFGYFGNIDRGMVAFISASSIFMMAAMFYEALKHQLLYWIVITLYSALHLIPALTVDFRDYSGPMSVFAVPIAIADAMLLAAILIFVREKTKS